MRRFLANAYVGRIGGALLAAGTVFLMQHDAKAAIVTGVTFIVYGAAHTTTAKADS